MRNSEIEETLLSQLVDAKNDAEVELIQSKLNVLSENS